MVARSFCQLGLVTLIALVGVSFSSSVVFAQIDPSSELLIDTSGRQSSLDNGLDSGRYTVRPKSTPKKVVTLPTPAPTPAPSPAPPPSAAAAAAATATTSEAPSPSATPSVSPTPQSENASVGESGKAEVVSAASASATTSAPAPQQVEAAASPATTPTATPVFDRRTQILDLSLSPVYIYNNSASSYWYRSYYSSSPGAHINANVWLTDSFGLHASFLTSLSASLKDSVDQARVVEATQNWFDVGLRFRHFASDKPKSPALVLGLDYSEYRFNASTSATMRDRLTTTGAQVLGGLEFPTSKHYMWTVDVSLIPKAKHEELETQSKVKSGTANETNSFGAGIGGVIRVDSKNAYFWKISHRVEKNVFSGTASAADPISGVTPTGVSVTNSTTVFELGCTWGN